MAVPEPRRRHRAATAAAAVAGHPEARADRPGTLAGRIRRTFTDSMGAMVSGMGDGTVSIIGLVFGVAAAAPDSDGVLLAGATGAIAAAVSMLAGTYLDAGTANDLAAAELAGIMGTYPETRLEIAAAVGTGAATRQNPYARPAWMFVTGLLAAAMPVIPFALFALAAARISSLAVTLVLLAILGVARARAGHRRMLPAAAQTVGIAAAAAAAGLAVGKLIS